MRSVLAAVGATPAGDRQQGGADDDEEEAGLGAGLINTSQGAGGALGLAVVATIAYTGFADRLAGAGNSATRVLDAYTEARGHVGRMLADRRRHASGMIGT